MAQRDILIVDDDRQVREVLHQIFIAAGYNCLLANDGREGVEVFKAGRPPLVVTDLKMPGITGIELLQQVRAVDDDVAVIVLTGAADVKTAIASLKLGAHDFIMKPWAPSFRLAIAVFTSAAPVSTITATSSSTARTCWRSSMPVMPGILRSVTTSGGRPALNTSTPSRPSFASRQL